MKILVFILISVVAFASHSKANQEEKGNVRIVKLGWNSSTTPQQEVLLCNATDEARVYWEKDNERKGNGKSLEILVQEPLDAGTYNCCDHDTHKLISSETIYVMKKLPNGEIAESVLKDLKEPKIRTFFRCTANNYSGNFTCFWRSTIPDSEFKFKIEAGSKGNIICGEPVKNTMNHEGTEYSVSCKKEKNCSFTQEYESNKMLLHVYHSRYIYENHSHNFFFKDIIKPDATECLVSKSGILKWVSPKTWSTPPSYFGLIYQLKATRPGQKEQICEVTDALNQNGDLACYKAECLHIECSIRSRNRYHEGSPWSNWSETCKVESHKNDRSRIHEDKSNIKRCKCKKN